MPALTKTRTNGHTNENGKPKPAEPKAQRASDLPSDLDELKKIPAECLEQIKSAESSIVPIARRCGEAWIEIKERLGHGPFESYLKENFPKSKRTAEHYMRVAKDWKKVVEQGLEETSLRKVIAFLMKKPKEKKPTEAGKPPKEKVYLSLTPEEEIELEPMLRKLIESGAFKTDSPKATILEAIRFAYREYVSDAKAA